VAAQLLRHLAQLDVASGHGRGFLSCRLSGRDTGLAEERRAYPALARPVKAHFIAAGSATRGGAGNWKTHEGRLHMNSVAKVSEISARSDKSFEDAIHLGIARANKTLRNITSAWVKEQRMDVTNGKVTGYQVNMMVTFVLDD
jgi:flavin-binding protein dodecin